MLDKPMGEVIDSHEYVVRFNRFKFEPVEYTGKKCQLWVIARRSIVDVNDHPNLAHVTARVPSVYQEVRWKNKRNGRRSTGVGALFWFLDTGYNVVLHAFDSFRGDKLHYFSDENTRHEHIHDKDMVDEAIAKGMPISFLE
jgi:hypothetical protein